MILIHPLLMRGFTKRPKSRRTDAVVQGLPLVYPCVCLFVGLLCVFDCFLVRFPFLVCLFVLCCLPVFCSSPHAYFVCFVPCFPLCLFASVFACLLVCLFACLLALFLGPDGSAKLPFGLRLCLSCLSACFFPCLAESSILLFHLFAQARLDMLCHDYRGKKHILGIRLLSGPRTMLSLLFCYGCCWWRRRPRRAVS